MNVDFVTVPIQELVLGEDLPVAIYLYIDFRFITFRGEGDKVDRDAFGRLEAKNVQHFFVKEGDRKKFLDWAKAHRKELSQPKITVATKPLQKAKEDAHRKALDIFQSPHPDKEIKKAVEVSKKLVHEIMRLPLSVQSLQKLQGYSQGTADHSVNVSILSVYLAMNMGYESTTILQHLGLGALLHDIGKTRIEIKEKDQDSDIEKKMKDHPIVGARLLGASPAISNEVKLIIEQHHENFDGTGYPKRLRGGAIYDLARIVSIANTFDELVGDGMGPLIERQRAAILKLDQEYYRRFDPQKLEKILRLLKLGV